MKRPKNKIPCFQLHRSNKLGKEGGKFIFIFYFDMEKLHRKVHFINLYVDVQNTLLSAAEIFLTRSKVNLLCTGGGEVSGGGE